MDTKIATVFLHGNITLGGEFSPKKPEINIDSA